MISARRLCRNGRRLCWAPAGRRHAGRMSPARSSRCCSQFRLQTSQELLSRLRRAAGYFPGMPCYEHFVALQKSVFVPLVFFLVSHLGGPGSTTSTPPPWCATIIASTGTRSSPVWPSAARLMGWFFGFKLHLVFNNRHEIVALKLTPGNVHDTKPVPALTRELTGKLFGDKGYIGRKLAEDLLRRGLTLFTRVRRNMKSLPLSLQDKALLNARNMAETIGQSRNSHPSICPSIDPSSTPSFTSSRPSPPTRSTRSSPSSTFNPAIVSKPQPEKPLIRVSVLSIAG